MISEYTTQEAISLWEKLSLEGKRAPLVVMTHKTLNYVFIGELIETIVDQNALNWDPQNGVYHLMLYPIESACDIDLGRGAWEITDILRDSGSDE